MKVLRYGTKSVLKDQQGRILKVRESNYVEPLPDVFMVEVAVEDGQEITLPLISGTGYVYDFKVDWSDGSPIDHITAYNDSRRIHTYQGAGKYVIYMTGQISGWSLSNVSSMRLLITRCISWGNVHLKRIDWYGCTALTTLPEQMGRLTELTSFLYFCYGCTSLVGIPYGVFFDNTIACDFSYAFYNCTALRSIPETTFKENIAATTFAYAFSNCSKLEYIPGDLFKYNPDVISFSGVFRYCQSPKFTTIPPRLFSYQTKCAFSQDTYACDFSSAFYYSNYIDSVPAGLFDNIKVSNASSTFYGCSGVVSIPEYLFAGQNKCTNFSYTFYVCTSLLFVPAGLFKGCVANTSFVYTFGSCSSATSIPSGLFDDCPLVSSFQCTFTSCVSLLAIPYHLFDYNTAVTSFYSTFSSCRNVSFIPSALFVNNTEALDFSFTFSYLGATASPAFDTIPEGLFLTNPKASTFRGTFSSTKIRHIPSTLFSTVLNALYFGQESSPSGYGVFANCSELLDIPHGLFDKVILATDFSGAFYNCDKLTGSSVPSTLFRYNTAMTSASYLFANSGMYNDIDPDLFSTNTALTNASYAFSGCLLITSVPSALFTNCRTLNNVAYCFSSTGISLIPESLFSTNVLIQNFSGVFSSCFSVVTIPADLFTCNVIATNFSYAFYYCNSLETIPITLFDSCPLVTTFAYCFRAGNPTTANKVTGPAPDLWSRSNTPTGTSCFYSRTAMSNYQAIPASWK